MFMTALRPAGGSVWLQHGGDPRRPGEGHADHDEAVCIDRINPGIGNGLFVLGNALLYAAAIKNAA